MTTNLTYTVEMFYNITREVRNGTAEFQILPVPMEKFWKKEQQNSTSSPRELIQHVSVIFWKRFVK